MELITDINPKQNNSINQNEGRGCVKSFHPWTFEGEAPAAAQKAKKKRVYVTNFQERHFG